MLLCRGDELVQRRLHFFRQQVEIGQPVEIAQQAEVDLTVVTDDGERQQVRRGEERKREDGKHLPAQ